MQNMHEFLKIKHGHEHGHVQNIHMLFVTEAERRLQALFPAPKGLHTHCPLPLEVPELKILKSTTTPIQLTGILPITTHFIYSHFFYVPPSLDICIFSYLKRSFSKFTTNISQFSSVIQLYPTLRDPMDCSTPGLPVHHQLPEFTQTHIH